MSRMVEKGESWVVVNRLFCCEQCGVQKKGYRVPGLSAGSLEPCAPPLGWTVKDNPARFFCSIECVDKYDAKSPVHVVDQSGQPFGSVRRCCNQCGAMAVTGMIVVESLAEWWDLPPDRRCDKPGEKNGHAHHQ